MNTIPAEKLPEYFKDESRRNVLYAPLRNKSVNPNDWNTKISSWSQLINLYCSCNNAYSFTLESLKAAFYENGRTPCCIAEVLQQMAGTGDITPIDIFMQEKPISWKQWVTKTFISSPISWSFNKVKNLVLPEIIGTTYVPVRVLEQDGDELLSRISVNNKNKLISLKEYLEMDNKDTDKAKDFKILFISLYNRRKVDILELQNEDISTLDNFLIKFKDDHDLKKISEVDLGIRTLEENEKALEKNIENLEDTITQCINEAKLHLSKGHKQLAKACLRKKHDIQNRIDKKLKALYNVQTLLHQLHDTKLDESVWKSYKEAIGAFETTLKKGINEDAVEDTMLKLGEILEIQGDIENALSRPVIDVDADLEEELAQLLKEDDDDNFNKGDIGSPDKKIDEELLDSFRQLELNLPSVPNSPVCGEEDHISSQLS